MISIGVVGHNLRKDRAARLADAVRAEVLSMDTGGVGCNKNHINAMAWLHDEPAPWFQPSRDAWAVILEDDAVPINGFRAEAQVALSKAPSDIVSFYLGRGRPEHWQDPIMRVLAADVSWLQAPDMLHAVAYAIRWSLVPSFLERVPDIKKPIDEAISVWAKGIGQKVSYSRPSLVNHADIPPIIPDSERKTQVAFLDPDRGIPAGDKRVAWMFGPRKVLLDKTWDSTARDIPEPVILGPHTS